MSSKSGYFVLTLPLAVEKWQADNLDRRMEVNKDIYNALLGRAMKRYRQMVQTRAYRNLMQELKTEDDTAKRKQLYRQKDALVEQYHLRRFDLTKDAARYRQAFKENTDSPICQNLAENVWRAVDKLITGQGQQVRFKKERELNDLSGKTNRSSIMYRNGYVKWKGLLLRAVSKNNAYEREALQHEIRCCRIKRREIRGKWKYYVDLVMEGSAPIKHSEILGVSGEVQVNLTPDRQHKGFVVQADMETASKPFVREIIPNTSADRHLENEKQKIQKFLYRSRMAMNPQNYGENGKILSGSYKWKYSRRYQRERKRYRELCRKQKERRRQYQCRLADQILSMGDCFYSESRLWRMKGSSGYGREIGYSAPGTFVEILKRKCAQYKKEFVGMTIETA